LSELTETLEYSGNSPPVFRRFAEFTFSKWYPFQKNVIFSKNVVEFVKVIDKSTVRMRVWERGSGITMACGTGACASASAAVSKNHCNYNDDISVILDGGTLKIDVASDYRIIMTGPAETIYEGEVEV